MADWFFIFFRIYDEILFYFASPQWQRMLFYLKIFSVIISLLLEIGIIYLLIKINFVIQKENLLQIIFKKPNFFLKKRINKKWFEILQYIELKNYKMAIIECDKLLEEILKKMLIKGETVAERLAKINKEQISNIEKLKEAHKVRNQIVHNIDYQISEETAKRVIDIYKTTFQELELIEHD